jgi:hypothetical protein
MTNKELLCEFWLRQLKSLSVKTVLVRESGDSFSVVPESNFYWSAKICACEDAKEKQRQTYELLKANLLTRWHIHYFQVYFDTDLAKEAFNSARQFWLTKGLPELKNVNMITQDGKAVSLLDLNNWQSECYQMLVDNFQHLFEQEANKI